MWNIITQCMDNIEHRYQKNKIQDFNHTETNKEKKRVARNHQPLINNKKKKKKTQPLVKICQNTETSTKAKKAKCH